LHAALRFLMARGRSQKIADAPARRPYLVALQEAMHIGR
jgi:hypothetical protein